MKKCLLFLFPLLLLSGFASIEAGPSGPRAGRFDYYLLALSWQPAFCEYRPGLRECRTQTAARYDARNLVLHGLWPNRVGDRRHRFAYCNVDRITRGYDRKRKWCKLPGLSLDSKTAAALGKFMPGKRSCLERHEWVKHGSCSGLSRRAYYRLSISLVRKLGKSRLNRYLGRNVGRWVRRSKLRSLAVRDFGSRGRGSVSFRCRKMKGKKYLSEIQFRLKRGISPGTPLKNMLYKGTKSRTGNCPRKIYIDSV